MDAINVCTMVLVDALNPLKITNGHAHNMKITKKRSFMLGKPNVSNVHGVFYDNETHKAHSKDAFCTHCIS